MTTAGVVRNMAPYGSPTITQKQLSRVMRRATILGVGTLLRLECNVRGEHCESRTGVLTNVTAEGMILAVPTIGSGSWRMFVAWTDLWAGHTRVVEGRVAHDIREALEGLASGVRL